MDKRISELKLQSVIGSMKLENLDLTGEEIETCKKILEGQTTADEVCKALIEQQLRKSTDVKKVQK